MNRFAALFGGIVVVGIGSLGMTTFHASTIPYAKGDVKVHCRNGNTAAFVTPQKISIKVGDAIEWSTAGSVVADSIQITLKDPKQAWPFNGAAPSGGGTVGSGAAQTRGTFGYNVIVVCRKAGGGTERVVIDPDIIID